jgi:outer membrane protein assembly factor BamA
VRPLLLALVALAACRTAPSQHAQVPAPCGPHRIGEVTVTGAAPDAVPQLAVLEGTFDDPARIARTAQIALDGLRARGHAAATLAITRRMACHVDLHVAVALGPRYRIERIAFETDDAFPRAERLAVIEDALGTVNTVGGIYIEYRMQRALRELERRYRDAGWLDASFGAPRATYDPSGAVTIMVPVTAGPRFRIGSVKAIGAGPSTRDAVLQMLGLRAGDYYDGPRIRTAIERARQRLARWVELRTRIAGDRPEIDLEAVVEGRR